MRGVGILLGLVVAGASAVGASALSPGPEPTLVTAGAGLLGTGVVGLVIEAIDVAVERHRLATPFGRGGTDGLSKADRIVITLGAGAVFVRMALVPLVADPFRIDGVVLTTLAVSAVGVVVGYRTAHGRLLDGLRHGVLACGLGGALCVSLAAYHAPSVVAVGTFDAVVAGSGLVLPVAFGLFGGLSGVAGWWLADRLAGADPLA